MTVRCGNLIGRIYQEGVVFMALVITIGRQYGSAGIEIGKKVAEILNVPFYDKELVSLAAQKSNMSPEALEHVDERATNSFLYSIVSGNYSMKGLNTPVYYDMPINDKLFIAQTDVIKSLAHEDCVIVGRCADYVLENEENIKTLNVFLYAPVEYRIGRVMETLNTTRAKAKDAVSKADKRRRNYYEYYTGKDWGAMKSYDMSFDVSALGEDNVAQIIAECAKKLKK